MSEDRLHATTNSHDFTATEADFADATPQHYGDPIGEQWALEAGRGLVDRSDMGVVTVSGPDRQTWLTNITSQVITGMVPGDSRELLVLSPEGRIEHAAGVVDDGDTTWLITEGDHAPGLRDFLDSMRFALRVEVELRKDMTVFGSVSRRTSSTSEGDQPADSAVQAGAASDLEEKRADLPGLRLTWNDPWPGVTEGGTQYFQGRHPGERFQMKLHIVDANAAKEFADAWLAAGQGGKRRMMAGMLAWEAVRIAAWRPRVGVDTDDRSIPAELDWLRTAVHIDKGCYRGQESIARVLNLGRPPRRLVYLQLDGLRADLPEPGHKIEVAGRVMGVVTSVARHGDEGPIALALVARNLPADQVLDLGGVAGAQELIIPVDGKSAVSPTQRPGADLNRELRRNDVKAAGGLGGLGAR
ncbi:YgfZ/GcvT domain-containing protein [Schaalia vaccimaxillae]|uniref:CAF17-like 4Fe-4S cluster assembly/insertion protein YgfZ n=1 Tax=Schaalia vaccimaxillae TaxID=183916 RepID=UPI0003B69CF2|nr:folate-binding protein YgfZ [Schaalia vaccimaxillae]